MKDCRVPLKGYMDYIGENGKEHGNYYLWVSGPCVFWASGRPTKVQILVRVLPVLVALLIVHRWTWRWMNAGDYLGRYEGFTGII